MGIMRLVLGWGGLVRLGPSVSGSKHCYDLILEGWLVEDMHGGGGVCSISHVWHSENFWPLERDEGIV